MHQKNIYIFDGMENASRVLLLFSLKNGSFTHHFSITPETQHSISNAKSQKESTGSRAFKSIARL